MKPKLKLYILMYRKGDPCVITEARSRSDAAIKFKSYFGSDEYNYIYTNGILTKVTDYISR